MKHTLCLILLVAVSFTGCSKKKSSKAPPPPRVTTTTIKQETVPVYIDAIGQVIAPVTVNIRPQVAGKLLKTYVQQGAIVKEGDVLYEVDSRPYQAILDEALAQLAHDQALYLYAQRTQTRNKPVAEKDYISILSYEQFESNTSAAQAQLDLDKAAVTAAQINVDYCKVMAPVSGKISFFNVDVGNIVAIDDPNQLTVIRPFSPIDITFSLPQQQFEIIRQVQGDAGEWKFVATLPDPHTPFAGTTYFIDNQLDQTTGTILLKGRLPNENRALWPGQFIRVKVLHKMAENALLVPPSTVLIGKDGPYVYTVDNDGKAVVENVTVLTRTDAYYAIQSPKLHAGDKVIVDGQINVAPGIKVAEVEASHS